MFYLGAIEPLPEPPVTPITVESINDTILSWPETAPILAAFERWCRTLPEIPQTVEEQERMYAEFKDLYEQRLTDPYQRWFGLWWNWTTTAVPSTKKSYQQTRDAFFQGIRMAHELDFGNC